MFLLETRHSERLTRSCTVGQHFPLIPSSVHLAFITFSDDQLDCDESSDTLSSTSTNFLRPLGLGDSMSHFKGSGISLASENVAGKHPRRELIWKHVEQGGVSLAAVSEQYGDLLDVIYPSSGALLQRCLASNKRKSLHRCPGYSRDEIKLTPSIFTNAVISHTTPSLREICTVCGKLVEEGGNFHCVCGQGDWPAFNVVFI